MTEQRAIDNLISIKTEIEYETDDTKQMKRIKYETINVAISALEEIQQYQALGTVEELREAIEKQRAKKPLGGVDIDGNEYAICRECSAIVADENWIAKYCPDCGNKIDWSKEE